MHFAPDYGQSKFIIAAYDESSITVNEQNYTNSLIVTPEEVITPWTPKKIADMTESDLLIIEKLNPAVFILGTGAEQQFPARQLLLPLLQKGIGVEVMNNAAACRTFNVLCAEGRNVAVGLLF